MLRLQLRRRSQTHQRETHRDATHPPPIMDQPPLVTDTTTNTPSERPHPTVNDDEKRRKHGRGRDEVVSDEDGEPLFRIRPQRGAFALLLPRAIVTPRCLDDIKRALTELLQRERSERDDLSKHIGRPGGVADLRPRTLDRQDAFGTQ